MCFKDSMKNTKSCPTDVGFGIQRRTEPGMGNSALKESRAWRTDGFTNAPARKLMKARNLTTFAEIVPASTLNTLKKFHVQKTTGAV